MSTNHPGFWGGSTVKDGKVRKLPAANFKEFAERILNVPVQFPLTRAEFWGLPDDKARDRAKDGFFVCSCAFTGNDEIQRNDANATHLTSVTLDLDSGDFLAEMEKFPETISEALYPHNHVVWHTAKSRPGVSPRLKILVEVAPCSTEHLKRFLAHVVFLLGIPRDFKGAKESAVVSQAQYRGILFKGEAGTPIIASRVNGIPMHLSDLPELEPEEEELISGRTYADQGESDEFYGLAYLPVQNLKVEDIREALDAIDSDVERPVWLSVAAALRHQFSDEDQAREAYEAFVDWSARGQKFAGRKDTWCVWKSLRSHIKGRPPVTIRSLFKHAIDAGWDSGKVAKKLAQSVEEWIAECNDAAELMQEGAKRIAEMPFVNALVEESMIVSLRKRLIALGETLDKTTLKKEVAKIRNDDKKAKREARANETPPWLSPFIYISTDDVFYNIGNGVTLKPAAFDRTYAKEMMPKDEIPANGVPIMQPGAFSLNVLKILRVDEAMYDPTQNEDLKIFPCKETGKLYINTYDFNSLPVPDPEYSERAEKLIRQLITQLIGDPYLIEVMLDYLALQCQFPGRKIPWSFLIQSVEGAGKGTLGEVMEAVLGPINVKIISSDMMKAGFNEWARNCVLGIFNEVHMPGDRRDQVMNGLKPLITDPTIAVTVKHSNAECRVPNFVNYIAFSNFRDAAHMSAGDRRWCIVFSPIQTKEQAETLNTTGHFTEIRWLTSPEGASALRYYFMKRVISPDFPLTGHAPATKYRAEVIEQSKNSLQIAVEDIIEDGDEPLIGPLVIHEGRLKEMACRLPRDAALLPRFLSLMGYERESAKRVMVEGNRGVIWVHTQNWKGKDALAYLKARVKAMPGLDEEPDCEFS